MLLFEQVFVVMNVRSVDLICSCYCIYLECLCVLECENMNMLLSAGAKRTKRESKLQHVLKKNNHIANTSAI